ncbi:MFS transporter [Pseudoclavibacter chungangensis]|uniref:MFS transporter n=1 Tax=Pseudoclavibacter chungangensis TaxID=587635 RepID=A0A7J5BR54_9MICO|nr:MFS transporter [Pseudoclavibacter chungangensis]KAB1655997.1 MFS transporter [Pseudoclavibacter chungangensis]NYJ66444.1 MFS family permease [Pseudoclavibacter chungangensis]
MKSSSAYAIIAVTSGAYLVAVAQRSSLGVVGVLAAERFEASATALSTLAVAQLVVYAGLQVPVGMLLDRFGPTKLIAIGAGLMAVGQTAVALAPDLGGAVAGRMLVGAGDATTYVSGLRLIAAWFPSKRVPIMTQWYGSLGQLGQVLSAVPFAALLGTVGWVPAFCSIASLSVIVLVAVLILLRDSPAARSTARPVAFAEAFRVLRGALARPGTRLGFWTHFTTQFPMTVFQLLWGYPLLVTGLGMEPLTASALLPVIVVAGMVAGPLIGIVTARFPLRRSNVVLLLAAIMLVGWVAFLVWPGSPPFWAVVVLLVLMGACGVGSTIGFDFARTANPASSFGSASGFVNVGGFTATFTSMFLIGLLLDLGSRGGLEPLDAYRGAFWVVPAVMVVGMAAIVIVRRKARRRLGEEEGIVVDPLWVALVRAWRRGGKGRSGHDSAPE